MGPYESHRHRRFRRRPRGGPYRASFLIALCLAAAGLLFQLLHGDRGSGALRDLRRLRVRQEAVLLDLKAANSVLSDRISFLRGPNVDTDYLDERVRIVLGLSRKNEIVVVDGERFENATSTTDATSTTEGERPSAFG